MVTILSWTSSSGVVYTGDTFVDASYEGDLLARAGVSYTVGREGIAKYNESYAGTPIPFPIRTTQRGRLSLCTHTRRSALLQPQEPVLCTSGPLL